jgi:hypothetical protein
MIAYTFGPLLFGWYGIFLMPMLLVLVFHFARIVLPELVQGRDIQPFALDPAVDPVVGQPSLPADATVSADGEGGAGDVDDVGDLGDAPDTEERGNENGDQRDGSDRTGESDG